MRFSFLRAFVALVAVMTLLACTHPRTQIVLLLETDMDQGPSATLTHVRITVKSTDTGQVRSRVTYALRRVGSGTLYELPGTLGISALDNDGRRSVEVNIDAVRDPGGDGSSRAPMFTYYAIAPFTDERTTLLQVFLADRCRTLAAMCQPDETCGLNGCMPRQVMSLPEVTPNFAPDATPMNTDGAVTDGAAVDVSDASVVSDASDVSDGSDVRDVTDASDVTDATTITADVVTLDVVTTDLGVPDAARDAALVCSSPMADCDGNAANGCETNVQTDPLNCNTCGMRCPVPANAAATCTRTGCGIRCAPSFDNCDGNAANGCETALSSDVANCSACGRACTTRNGTPACTTGTCTIARCNTGYDNCNGDPLDGCETALLTDPRNCGGCGRPCATGQVCSSGVCVTSCPTGQALCAGACVDTQTSPSHCGACGNTCSTPANTMSTCSMGACGSMCVGGFGDCDRNAGNGCETSLGGSVLHCGRCGNACRTLPNSTPTCVNGLCGTGCNIDWADCDRNVDNGCEANLSTSVDHCGGCGRSCGTRPNMITQCFFMACSYACAVGFSDCDRNLDNGCEVASTTCPSDGGVDVVDGSADVPPPLDGGLVGTDGGSIVTDAATGRDSGLMTGDGPGVDFDIPR